MYSIDISHLLKEAIRYFQLKLIIVQEQLLSSIIMIEIKSFDGVEINYYIFHILYVKRERRLN